VIKDGASLKTLLLLIVCFCSAISSAASAEIERNTHIFAMIQINTICRGETQATGEFVRVVIHRSTKGNYNTYMMNKAGAAFGPNGGEQRNTLDGVAMLSELNLLGRRIFYREQGTQSSGNRKATVTMEVEITADENSCSVNSCSMDISEVGAEPACRFRCWPEECEVRPGPAS